MSLMNETSSEGYAKGTAASGEGVKVPKDRSALLKGRIDWKVVAAALGLKCQQCQRRIKSLSADLPRLRVLYRMTSRGAIENISATCPAIRLEAAGMGTEAICKSVQHVLNNLHLTVSTAPIDHLDQSSLPKDLPSTADGIRKLFKVEPLFPNRQRSHAWPDASPSQACILDLLFLVLSVQQEHYNSELALRLLARFSEADVERALKLLRENGMIVKRRDGDRSCGLSRALEELMSPSKSYVLLHDELRVAAKKRKWNLDSLVSGGQVARTVRLLLERRLEVETDVPASLGLTAGAPAGDKRSAGGGGVGAHILSALFPEDDSEGGGRMLDQKISLPQCQVDMTCIDEDDGLGVSVGCGYGTEEEAGTAMEADAAMQDLSARVSTIVGPEGLEGRSINVKYAMLLPLWDEQEGGDEERVRGVEWCRKRLEALLGIVAAGREDGVALGDLDLEALGFESAEGAGRKKRRTLSRKNDDPPAAGNVAGVGSGGGGGGEAEDVVICDPRMASCDGAKLQGREMLEMAVIALQNQGKVLRVRGLDHYRYVSTRWSHMWSLNREAHRPKPQAPAPAAGAAGDGSQASGAAVAVDKGSSSSRGASAGAGVKAGVQSNRMPGVMASGATEVGRSGKRAGGDSVCETASEDDAAATSSTGGCDGTGRGQEAGENPAGSERVGERQEGGGPRDVKERLEEALADGQVAGPWLTMEGEKLSQTQYENVEGLAANFHSTALRHGLVCAWVCGYSRRIRPAREPACRDLRDGVQTSGHARGGARAAVPNAQSAHPRVGFWLPCRRLHLRCCTRVFSFADCVCIVCLCVRARTCAVSCAMIS